MNYTEIIINTPTAEIDCRCERLTELGADGFIIENEDDFHDFLENNHQYWDYVDADLENKYKGISRIKCYLSDDAAGAAVAALIIAEFSNDVSTRAVADSDWENNWRDFYKPIETGDRLVVVPEWEDVPPGSRLPLRLDPGLIFGTGSHATTRMCLSALEGYAGSGKKVLDLGCGSGILGIGALILGCDRCIGVDIDPKAPDVAESNAALNGIFQDRFKVLAGDIISDQSLRSNLGKGYNIVLANIVSDVIIPLSAYTRQFMSEDSIFITSGIIDGRQGEVKAALEKNGFEIINHYNLEEWHCFVAR